MIPKVFEVVEYGSFLDGHLDDLTGEEQELCKECHQAHHEMYGFDLLVDYDVVQVNQVHSEGQHEECHEDPELGLEKVVADVVPVVVYQNFH